MSDDSHKSNEDIKGVGEKESLSLKRGREASLEPSVPESQQTPASSLKKNRLEQARSVSRTSPIPEGEDAPAAKQSQKKVTVNEVRRKVEEMSHAEGADAVEKDVEIVAEGSDVAGQPSKEKDLKRKALERGESSTVIGESEAKRPKDSPPPSADAASAGISAGTPAADTATISTPAPAAKKPQATFGAFSSSASPFAAKPSSGPASSSAFGAASSSTPKPFSSSGFGGFSGSSSPFAAKKTSTFGSSAGPSSAAPSSGLKNEQPNGSKEATGEEKAGAEDADDAESGKQGNFGDILSGVGEDEEVKDKPLMTEKDVVTGEEDESTKFQMRTKLYVMQSDNSWRERGVGVLRLNVRRGDGHGARLVMRAEGVLRLILNVSLYVGQTCLEDGKHVRTTVFEDGERKFVTFRTGSVKAAQELAGHIQEFIPLETKSAKSPLPASGSAESDAEAGGPTGGW